MTNKIINGIDVSECPLFDKKTGCYHTFNGECVKDSCTVYKWLLEFKRLQEENEKLKEKNDIYENSIIANHDGAVGKRLMEVLQALDEIREKAQKHIKAEQICFADEIINLIDEVLNDRD